MRLFEINQPVTYRNNETDQDAVIKMERIPSGHYHILINGATATQLAHENNLFLKDHQEMKYDPTPKPTQNIFTGETEQPPATKTTIALYNEPTEGTTAMPPLEVDYRLPVIAFDKAALIAYAKSIAEKFKGVILTDDNETEIKAINTQLNKAQKELNQRRIDTEKLISAPIKQLKSDVDEVIAIFAEVQENIKKQLEEAKQAQQAERKKEIALILEGFISTCGLPDNYAAKIQLKEEYYTTKKTNKYIREDIEGQIIELRQQYQHERDALAARETIYNALAQAYPDVSATLADLHGVPNERMGDWFAKQRANNTPPVIEVPTFTAPVIEEVKNNAPTHHEANAPTLANASGNKTENNSTESDRYMVRLLVYGNSEEDKWNNALALSEYAESKGIKMELLDD